MEEFMIIVVLHAIVFCQAALYINPASRPCSWTVTSPGRNGSAAAFAKDNLRPLGSRVCKALGCGEIYKINDSTAQANSSCLAGCSYHNHELNNCSHTAGGECRILSQVVCAAPYITPTSEPCVWNLRSPESAESTVALTRESVRSLSSEICESVGCGEAFLELGGKALPRGICLTGCVYHNFHLRNCSAVNGSNCFLLSKITCGNHMARLVGSSHSCGGRVELWRAGQWGTVCDDGWDKQDADVVCGQLGCGYAISVFGQGGPFGLGSGPIHLDELNCTGRERSLWECPAVTVDHDCGHKEDAGVVCSEYKALRLTGGLDHCSGRVEVHRNGSWGTVCDPCWEQQEASMACGMLGCGGVKEFSFFEKPFTHKNGTLWYYICKSFHTNLWQCQELEGKNHICEDTNAAGVICEHSLGLPVPTTSNPINLLTAGVTITAGPKWVWSVELLGCIGLSSILLIAFIINVILCCLIRRKRKVHTVQQQYSNLQTSVETEENNYRDSIHLVKVTSNGGEPSAPPGPPQMWTQSSIESSSYDTDHEPNNSGPDTTFPLSTFRNSMRYSAGGRTPTGKGTHLQSLTEEVQGYPVQTVSKHHTPADASRLLTVASSGDSFETSSTSSGEWYENTMHDAPDLNTENYETTEENGRVLQSETLLCPVSSTHDCENTGKPVEDHSNGTHNLGMMSPCGGDDSPIYSPVTRDSKLYSSDSDYDDIANYLRGPDQ